MILDRSSLGPAAGIQIKIEEAGPGSRRIDVNRIYVAVYRLRNLSNTTVKQFFVRLVNQPPSIMFDIKQGENKIPDWDDKKKQIIQESHVSLETGWLNITIPYLNPYYTTKHEALLELASYKPLDSIKISGGGEGINFKFSKPCEERTTSWDIATKFSIGILIVLIANFLTIIWKRSLRRNK